MADKVRGKLNQIDWSKSNQVSINVNKKKSSAESASKNRSSTDSASQNGRASALVTSPRSNDGEIPVNRYQSVVAPVKSGREDERVPARQVSADASRNGNRRGSRRSSGSGNSEDGTQVYVGYIGSLRIPPDSMSTGIKAIQGPMSGLYFPYREKKTYAQERIITLGSSGLQVYYLPDQLAEEPASFTINWQDILYVEPLRFTTRKAVRDRKGVLAAFEPCEAQRVALLGNRDVLFEPLSKQYKHISLLKHPALLCMVIRSPHSPTELFTHGYVCGTVEEAVFLARQVRDELEILHRESLMSGEPPSGSHLSASHMSINNDKYKLDKHSNNSSKLGSKSKKKKLEKRRDAREAYTTHTGNDEDDLGTYHFGMLRSTGPNSQLSAFSRGYDDMEEPANDNFVIGQPGQRPNSRRQSRNSSSSDFGSDSYTGSYSNGRPIGVVQPQSLAARDGFKVLPSDVQLDRSHLKPTAVNVKSSKFMTPELDLKLRMRQQEENEPILSSMAPRSVVNPLAEAEPEFHRKSFLSPTPGPISKMSTSLPFKPAAAMPQSGWHEPVFGNFKSKEEIENRLNSQMVNPKQLPKMESAKKEQEMENLFSSIDVNAVDSEEENNNFSMKASETSRLHKAMGFMP